MTHTEGALFTPDELGLAMEIGFYAGRARRRAAARRGWKTRRANASDRNRKKNSQRSTRWSVS